MIRARTIRFRLSTPGAVRGDQLSGRCADLHPPTIANVDRSRTFWQLARSDYRSQLVIAAVGVGSANGMDGHDRRIINGKGGLLLIVGAGRIFTDLQKPSTSYRSCW